MRQLRYRILPAHLSRTQKRQNAKKIYDRWWRPERVEKKKIYHLVDALLEANEDLKFANLVDLAFVALFARGDKRAEEVFKRDQEKYKIIFPWKD